MNDTAPRARKDTGTDVGTTERAEPQERGHGREVSTP